MTVNLKIEPKQLAKLQAGICRNCQTLNVQSACEKCEWVLENYKVEPVEK
jgi:hypothetical protein